MPLKAPTLDDRRFQDIFDEARRLIPKYCPEWTDHNLSDPGITLIELFASMMEMLLYRLNRVPDKSRITFLNMMGIELEAPKPAKAEITFLLSSPQTTTIPGRTEVATQHDDSGELLVFRTHEDLEITQPALLYLLLGTNEKPKAQPMPTKNKPLRLSNAADNYIYLGFEQDISRLLLELTCDLEPASETEGPIKLNFKWETRDIHEELWEELDSENPDREGGSGTSPMQPNQRRIWIYQSSKQESFTIAGQEAYWVRGHLHKEFEEDPDITLVLSNLRCVSMGGIIPAYNEKVIENEELGWSNGEHGQVFRVAIPPIVTPLDPRYEYIEVESLGDQAEVQNETARDHDREWESWDFRENFADSKANDPHWACDALAGEIRFGPTIIQPDRTPRHYGKAPPAGARIRLSSYRSCAGAKGNVGARTLALKTTIPYVLSATNRKPAIGGRDAETIEHAMMRAAEDLRTQERAVTAEDFEYLAEKSSGSIFRAKCLQKESGEVEVLLVPDIHHIKRPKPEDLKIPSYVEDQVRRYLDKRRLLCTKLVLRAPEYVEVIVNTRVEIDDKVDRENTRERIVERLYEFLHPITGYRDQKGWPFGRALLISDIYDVVQGIPGVKYISLVELRDASVGQIEDQLIGLKEDELLMSAQSPHTVSCVYRES